MFKWTFISKLEMDETSVQNVRLNFLISADLSAPPHNHAVIYHLTVWKAFSFGFTSLCIPIF